MNKSELSAALAKNRDLPIRKSEEIVDAVFDAMFRALAANHRIEIRGFGSFEVRDYDGYTGRNPKTGEQISVDGKKLPFFKAGKELRDHLKD
ncbi:MAG TPA: HU family DNA-binding protein [Desulfomonilaceae bacterium]|nr:HU family DNA-binding protein [Desulfomonilaceae bacterium]